MGAHCMNGVDWYGPIPDGVIPATENQSSVSSGTIQKRQAILCSPSRRRRRTEVPLPAIMFNKTLCPLSFGPPGTGSHRAGGVGAAYLTPVSSRYAFHQSLSRQYQIDNTGHGHYTCFCFSISFSVPCFNCHWSSPPSPVSFRASQTGCSRLV
ncbi:hypothetical protein VFPPC_15581 [Pochonia chlamydosporia 170]|uniref:Uncharacterized protein n=1 Tax=Pochonia chlamydosporia 170 TaxID=1380566 RepID=A0A179FZC1_METCM|nr:hypothetical protein VFPPC_15581 [Pochonia chlamydosporia 170]OAQ70461.1 hypothetical protein VFPPC_15581 [Pochonia chlamydosporia 170]